MWPLLKEVLGFLGAALLVAPWLRDFVGRVKATRLGEVRARGSLGDLLKTLQREDQTWLTRPKLLDLGLTVAGLVMIAAGFLIGVFLAWPPFIAGQ